jgi:hypothetical protein
VDEDVRWFEIAVHDTVLDELDETAHDIAEQR